MMLTVFAFVGCGLLFALVVIGVCVYVRLGVMARKADAINRAIQAILSTRSNLFPVVPFQDIFERQKFLSDVSAKIAVRRGTVLNPGEREAVADEMHMEGLLKDQINSAISLNMAVSRGDSVPESIRRWANNIDTEGPEFRAAVERANAVRAGGDV
jgi:hypothetical protein